MSKNWYIVTNNENLNHFINFGLIIDKQGFSGDSYIIDAMEYIPKGYIPCFTEDSLTPALKKSIEEDSNLDSCLLELDFNKVTNALTWGGCIDELDKVTDQLEDSLATIQKDDKINYILLPAPLPISIVKNVIVQNEEIKKNIQSSYELKFKNLHKRRFFKTRTRLFKQKESQDQSINGIAELWNAKDRLIDYRKIFSYGGALALLYYQTKNGLKSQDIFDFYGAAALEHSVFAEFGLSPFTSLGSLNITTNNVHVNSIFNDLINHLTPVQNHGVAKHEILNFLKNVSTNDEYTDKCLKLSKALENLNNRTTTKAPDAIFHAIINDAYLGDLSFRDFALLVTLFFLRDKIETALKFYHDSFEVEHYALIGIFYGQLFGIAEVPVNIRKIYNLSTWLSYRMAQFAYSLTCEVASFKEPAKPYKIYGEIFKLKSTKIRKVHDFYEWVDRSFNESGPSSLIESKFSLPKEGRLEGGYITAAKLPSISAKIDTDRLSECLQNQIKDDALFNYNEFINAYKRYI